MKSSVRKFFYPWYKFLSHPKIRHSLVVGGLRRYFYYDSREVMMEKVMEWANFRNLKGDYLEFGVFEGDSFIKAYHAAKIRGLSSMRFFAFDSFGGYPPLEGVDKECGYFTEGDYSCDLNTFQQNLQKGGVNLNEVTVTQGAFKDLKSTPSEVVRSTVASVVWIDCDIYKATLQALEFLVDHIKNGTIIVFADWFTCDGKPDMGQPLALQEWLKNHPEIHMAEYLTFGSKAFIVSKR